MQLRAEEAEKCAIHINMLCEEKFNQIYGRDAEGMAFCPYRVCPIGAHSDHNLGKITGLAIDKGIHIAYAPKQNGVVEMVSLQFPKRAQWHVGSVPSQKQNDWADYLRGATLCLARRQRLTVGLCGVIEGTLPIGGLSSSAAVIISFLIALCRVNGITLSQQEIIDVAYDAELNYVGVNVGKLDQSCEVLSRSNHLLYLDTLDGSYELIPQPAEMKPYKIAIFFSGLEHSLAGSKYNMRVDELRSGVYALQAFAGMEYGKFGEANARNVPREVYEQFKDRLPVPWAKRCEHWYTEFERVEKGAEAWRRGDIEAYGRLSFESGWSSIHNWESGAPEQITLYEIMTQTEGIYGGRFSGAGFKGCCMALIDPAYEESISRKVTEKYLKACPAMKEKYGVYICDSADGVTL
jgi:galactokinase/galacturonokinase